MKKISFIVLILFIMFIGFGCNEKEVEKFSFEIINETQCALKSFKGNKKDIVIPEKYHGYTVIKIGTNCFSDSSIEKVSFSENIIAVDSSAFSNCANLFEVKLNEKLKSINTWAFLDCTKLEYLYIPKSVEHISDFAFQGCASLRKIEFDEEINEPFTVFRTINTLGTSRGVFKDCIKLEYIIAPEKLNLDPLIFEGSNVKTIFSVNKDINIDLFKNSDIKIYNSLEWKLTPSGDPKLLQ